MNNSGAAMPRRGEVEGPKKGEEERMTIAELAKRKKEEVEEEQRIKRETMK